MAVGTVRHPKPIVLKRFEPARACPPGDAAIQRGSWPLYLVLPLRVGALWFLGPRVGRQRQKRGRNCQSYNGSESFLHLVVPQSSSASLDRAARAEAGRAELEGHLQALVTLRGYVNERGRPFSAASIAAMLAAGLLKPTRMLA